MADKKKSGKWGLYEAGDKISRKRKSCPKCGDGVFLAQHRDRLSCGCCGYTESTQAEKTKSPEKQGEEKSEGKKDEAKKKK